MTAKVSDIKDCPYWPRWLSLEQAACYVGVSVNTFLDEVEEGKWPKPVRRGKKGARLTWDRHLLDAASDLISGLTSNPACDVANAEAAALRLFGT
jgi:hypothetical protein